MFYNFTVNNPFDLYGELKKLNKKSLIIVSDKGVIPFHYPEKLHINIPSSKLIQVKDCGHFPYIDQPDILFAAIQSFMSSMLA